MRVRLKKTGGRVRLEKNAYKFVLGCDPGDPSYPHWYLELTKDTVGRVFKALLELYSIFFGGEKRAKEIINKFKGYISKGRKVYVGKNMGYRLDKGIKIIKAEVSEFFDYPENPSEL
jgi:hypothetical protein